MKIAILHHHLNRGGVTQVILSHLRALQVGQPSAEVAEILVLHGGRTDGWPENGGWGDTIPVRLAAVAGLDYDQQPELQVDALTDALAAALEAADCGPEETILHVHNHSLGKNVSLPGDALKRLAERGYRILLHIHDFAEDWRPENYQRLRGALATTSAEEVGRYLYPASERIHYALLNSRDRMILLGTNVAPAQVHLLPNPATAATTLPPHESALKRFQAAHGLSSDQRLILYPVRAIRRKNLGELLLWAALADAQTTLAVTLPATSEVELPTFQRWRQLAEALELRVLFNVGLHEGLSFEDNLAAADRIITTSVAEGFGLVFLECWLHERLLIGRNLPEITQDFVARGLDLSDLGDSLEIPIDWIGGERFVETALSLHQKLCAAYGQTMAPSSESLLRQRIAGGHVDFAAMTADQQTTVIRRAAEDPAAVKEILALNPWIGASLADEPAGQRSLIEQNAVVARGSFSLEATASDLASIYGTLFASGNDQVASLPQPENILHAFLDITRLCPVRIEP